MSYIYLLMTLPEIESSRQAGFWSSPSLSTEGFIHASPYDQLERVANKYYRERSEVHIVRVMVDRLVSEVRWEPAAGGLYPHIYGRLNFDAVDQIVQADRDQKGAFRIPPSALDSPRGTE